VKQEGLLGRHQSRLPADVPPPDKFSSQTTSRPQREWYNC